MRVEYKDLIESIEKAAVNETGKKLISKGYSIKINCCIDGFHVDLYAEKETEKLIYEFKLANIPIQQNIYNRLQGIAKKIGAKLRIVYVARPNCDKNIEYEGIENLIYDAIISDFRGELDGLSTHTYVDEILDVSIKAVTIREKSIILKGDCVVSLMLNYGSRSDEKNDDNIINNISCGLSFELELNNDRQVIDKKFEFDLDPFYEYMS